jgi:hypothetical protein
MKGECGTYGGEYRLLGCSAEKSKKKRDHFEYLGVSGRIILKMVLTK